MSSCSSNNKEIAEHQNPNITEKIKRAAARKNEQINKMMTTDLAMWKNHWENSLESVNRKRINEWCNNEGVTVTNKLIVYKKEFDLLEKESEDLLDKMKTNRSRLEEEIDTVKLLDKIKEDLLKNKQLNSTSIETLSSRKKLVPVKRFSSKEESQENEEK